MCIVFLQSASVIPFDAASLLDAHLFGQLMRTRKRMKGPRCPPRLAQYRQSFSRAWLNISIIDTSLYIVEKVVYRASGFHMRRVETQILQCVHGLFPDSFTLSILSGNSWSFKLRYTRTRNGLRPRLKKKTESYIWRYVDTENRTTRTGADAEYRV